MKLLFSNIKDLTLGGIFNFFMNLMVAALVLLSAQFAHANNACISLVKERAPVERHYNLPPFWEQWAQDFDESLRQGIKNLIALPNSYLSDMFIMGDQVMADLAAAGVVVSYGAQESPSIIDLLNKYEADLKELIQSGRVSDEQVLRPALAFKGPAGKYKIVRFGQKIPEGYTYMEDELPTKIYYLMLSKGYFPLGGTTMSNEESGGLFSFAGHDVLGHLPVFIKKPEYMAALREFAQKVDLKNLDALKDENKSLLVSGRSFFATETLILMEPGFRDSLLEQLKVDDSLSRLQNGMISVQAIQYHLSTLAIEDREEILKTLYRQYGQWTVRYGGTANDLFARVTNIYQSPSMTAPSRAYGQTLESFWFTGLDALSYNGDEALKYHAQFISALYNSSFVPAVEWVQAMDAQPILPHSPLYQYICNTGSYPIDSYIYDVYCGYKSDTSFSLLLPTAPSRQEWEQKENERIGQELAEQIRENPGQINDLDLEEVDGISTYWVQRHTLEILIESENKEDVELVVNLLVSNEKWAKHYNLLQKLSLTKMGLPYFPQILSTPHWVSSEYGPQAFGRVVFLLADGHGTPELVKEMEQLMNTPQWKERLSEVSVRENNENFERARLEHGMFDE